MGRLELLAWLNDFVETDYSKIEEWCDGVGYAQVIDAIHPGVVPLHKFDFNAKNKDDYLRNLKLLDKTISKLKIQKSVPVNLMSNGKFQSNMEFVQWLYTYTAKTAPNAAMFYNGYEKRIEAYCKQNNITDVSQEYMHIKHLIPNRTLYRNDNEMQAPDEYEQYSGNFNFNDNSKPTIF